jgi:molybdenum cofactor guanylyltransferase
MAICRTIAPIGKKRIVQDESRQRMRLLGAIIAGGKARRFGSDKALAKLDGKPLLQHVIDGLRPQCAALIVCGRNWPDMMCVADLPHADMGPLGGLCAALHYAQAHEFDAVISAGCDTLPVPDMTKLLGDSAAVVAGQHLFGFWPVTLTAQLAQHLACQNNHSMAHWLTATGARQIGYPTGFYNLNTPSDFMRYQQKKG